MSKGHEKYQHPFLSDAELDSGKIDLSGCPTVAQRLPQKEGWSLERVSNGSTSLKAFLAKQSATVQGGASRVHLGSNVMGTVSHDGSQWHCDFEHLGEQQRTSAVTRDDAVMQAARIVFNVEPATVQPTEQQLSLIARTAQTDRVGAATLYLKAAIPNFNRLSEKTLLSDPRFADALDAAVWFSWSHSTNSYSLSDENFPAFVGQFCHGKKLSLSLLDEAWRQYREQNDRQRFRLLPEQEPPSLQEIDDLSNEEVTDLYRATARQHARR